jgi:hypothetical protein
MTDVNTLFPSAYLKAADVEQPLVLTFASWAVETVGEGADATQKPCISFRERNEKWVLNKTNAGLLSHYMGSSNIDTWMGRQVELYSDPVPFQGKIVPAIRCRLPQPAPAVSQPPQPQAAQQPQPAPGAFQDSDLSSLDV